MLGSWANHFHWDALAHNDTLVCPNTIHISQPTTFAQTSVYPTPSQGKTSALAAGLHGYHPVFPPDQQPKSKIYRLRNHAGSEVLHLSSTTFSGRAAQGQEFKRNEAKNPHSNACREAICNLYTVNAKPPLISGADKWDEVKAPNAGHSFNIATRKEV